MEASKVYYTSFKTSGSENLLQKLRRLCITAGMKNIDFEDKYAAIKIHFGELGNLAFLRPNYAKVVVDLVKECGGKAFLTDCNTLYVGSRKNALDHMDTAYENGFTPFSTGTPVFLQFLHNLPQNKNPAEAGFKIGRRERIRTSDPLVPNQLRYQAALLAEILLFEFLVQFVKVVVRGGGLEPPRP